MDSLIDTNTGNTPSITKPRDISHPCNQHSQAANSDCLRTAFCNQTHCHAVSIDSEMCCVQHTAYIASQTCGPSVEWQHVSDMLWCMPHTHSADRHLESKAFGAVLKGVRVPTSPAANWSILVLPIMIAPETQGGLAGTEYSCM